MNMDTGGGGRVDAERASVERREAMLGRLVPVTEAISVDTPVRTDGYQAGLVCFQPGRGAGRPIVHAGAAVIAWVERGRGRLCLAGGETELAAGMLCHIPPGTEHNFQASGPEPMVMVYVTIRV